ncbi:MAG: sulfatase [Deltaproteobacteria bacterium]|nr:sulfatase [Deltaproteobacteria bacterium]
MGRANAAIAMLLTAMLAGQTGCSATSPPVRERTRATAASAAPAEDRALDDVPVGPGGGSSPDGARSAATAGATTGAPAAPPTVEIPADHRVVYDLAAHPERAELRHGGATVADLGVVGGARYTIGGFHTGAGRSQMADGASVQRLVGGRLVLAVPSDVEGAGALSVRGRGGRVAVSIGGRNAGSIDLPGNALGIGTLAIASGLRRGDVTVQLRVSAPDARIDWVRLGPPGDAPGESASPPAPDVLARREPTGSLFFLRDGWTAGWHLDVPEGALLAGLVESAVPATLEVVAYADGREPTALGTVRATPNGAPLRIDLAPIAGHVARIDLRATGSSQDAPLRIVHPRITAPGRGASTDPPRRPRNALVLLIDTLRADRLTAINPRSRVRTPNTDLLARTAATFVRAHAPECWTKPSVATLLSSLLPWQHGAIRTSSRVGDDITMLQEVVRRAGFQTAALVANGYVGERFGFRQGWDFWRNYVAEGRRNRADSVVRDVLERLDRRDTSRPFFFYVHTIDPHVPYTPPARFVRMYDAEPYSGVVSWERADFLDRVKLGQIALGARDRRRLEAQYDGEITFHDVHLQALIDGLESRGLAEDTLLVVTADHGEEFWEHGNVGHGHSVFEELVHVPLFVRAPGLVPAGTRFTDPAGLVDVMPTVLDALGVERPAGLAGRSLIPLVRGEDRSAPAVSVSGFMDDRRAASAGRWKIVLRGTRTDLFDLETDPRETRNVADRHPVALRYMRELVGLSLATTDGGATRDVPRRPRAQQVTIDPETERQLRELGYIPETRR